MTDVALLVDAFNRVQEAVHEAVDGLSTDQLDWQVDPQANSIGWLVWHLTRVQDDHIADVASTEQVWTAQGFVERFALPLNPLDHGYGHRPDQVAIVRGIPADLLVAYYDAVHEYTIEYVSHLTTADFDRIVDIRWDPPVTLGVRLVSVISDDLQHVGQAAYLRGVLERR